MSKPLAVLAVVACLSVAPIQAAADSITLNIATNNTFLGLAGVGEYFNYFTLDIPSELPDISGATLELWTRGFHYLIGASFRASAATAYL